MSIAGNQPEIRFNLAGPYGLQGISYEPKIMLVDKTIGTATENDDFVQLPAGTFISEVVAIVTDAGDANTTVSLGTDGDAEALITSTALTMETVNTFVKFTAGLYLAAADKLRIAISDTPVASAVRFVISYFELAAMAERGVHFNL